MEQVVINHIEHIKTITENILANIRVFALMGGVGAILFEQKTLYAFFKKKKKSLKDLAPMIPRIEYVLGGVIMTMLSRSMVSGVLGIIGHIDTTPKPESTGYILIDILWQTATYVSLRGLIGYIIAGLCLTISAGDRRWTGAAKFFYLITSLYILLTAYIYGAL